MTKGRPRREAFDTTVTTKHLLKTWDKMSVTEQEATISEYANHQSAAFFNSDDMLKKLSIRQWMLLITKSTFNEFALSRRLQVCLMYTNNYPLLTTIMDEVGNNLKEDLVRAVICDQDVKDSDFVLWAIEYGVDTKWMRYPTLFGNILYRFESIDKKSNGVMGKALSKYLEGAPAYDFIDSMMAHKKLSEYLITNKFQSKTLFLKTKMIEFAPEAIRKMFLSKEK